MNNLSRLTFIEDQKDYQRTLSAIQYSLFE